MKDRAASSSSSSSHRGGSSGGHHQTTAPPPANTNDDKRKPYLDKIVMKMNAPSPNPSNDEYNSITTFPNLEHCGIRTEFEPEITPVTNPHGVITPMYKIDAFEALKPIYRDQYELHGREVVFKRSHKQFIDDVLNDMEGTRTDQLTRKLKLWTTSKTQLGFGDNFNQSLANTKGNHNVASSSAYSMDPDHQIDPNNVTSHQQRSMASTRGGGGSVKEGIGGYNEHGKIVNKNGHRPPNKIALFKVLLDSVPAPKSPRKRFATIGEHRLNQTTGMPTTNNTGNSSSSNANNRSITSTHSTR